MFWAYPQIVGDIIQSFQKCVCRLNCDYICGSSRRADSHLPVWVWGGSWRRCCPWQLPEDRHCHQLRTSWKTQSITVNNSHNLLTTFTFSIFTERDRWILLVSPQRFTEDLTLQRVDVHVVLLQHQHRKSATVNCLELDQSNLEHTGGVTSSTYSSRSRAFLKSYSLARLLSSQMYSCGEETESRGCGVTVTTSVWWSLLTHGSDPVNRKSSFRLHVEGFKVKLLEDSSCRNLIFKVLVNISCCFDCTHYLYTLLFPACFQSFASFSIAASFISLQKTPTNVSR